MLVKPKTTAILATVIIIPGLIKIRLGYQIPRFNKFSSMLQIKHNPPIKLIQQS